MVMFHPLILKPCLLHLFKLTPLLWPCNLYLPKIRQLQKTCTTISHASSLFVFRLRRILIERPDDQDERINRWERAFRLFCQEMLPTAHSFRRGRPANEVSFHLMFLG
ncbi:hypothetical protein ACHQM5_016028 [Ranunculus cassubicifolius]